MNVFLPKSNILNSAISLDDKRLNKQCLETMQLLKLAEKDQSTLNGAGYHNHPVYIHYKDNINFLCYYGLICSKELSSRFKKTYIFLEYFTDKCMQYVPFDKNMDDFIKPNYIPFYCEGSKNDPTNKRTTENVENLFQDKLCKKWEQDKAKGNPPKWTNRDMPNFYIEYLKEKNYE